MTLPNQEKMKIIIFDVYHFSIVTKNITNNPVWSILALLNKNRNQSAFQIFFCFSAGSFRSETVSISFVAVCVKHPVITNIKE